MFYLETQSNTIKFAGDQMPMWFLVSGVYNLFHGGEWVSGDGDLSEAGVRFNSQSEAQKFLTWVTKHSHSEN